MYVSVFPGSTVWEGFHRRLELRLLCDDVSLVACAECCARSQDWYSFDIRTVSFHSFSDINAYTKDA
jgi:hypothetical protein